MRERAELAYDYAERAMLTLLGLSAVLRFLPSLAAHPINAVLVASEIAAVAMIVFRRRARQTDLSLYSVVIGLAGTTAPLLVQPGGQPAMPEWIAGMVIASGCALNISAKFYLNRSFGVAPANRGVKRQGPYRLMRHPMYAGYFITQLAFLAVNPTAWNLLVYAAAWTLQLLRISAEEKLLGRDAEYRAYAGATPFRLIPGIY
jgi:protein-S-isoprenylcysteine O-methyltransferase Ste14